MKQKLKDKFFITLIIACVFLSVSNVSAKIKTFTLIEKTRSASLIFIGNVTKSNVNSVLVAVDTVLKGVPDSLKVEVLCDSKEIFYQPPVSYQVGDKILLFAMPKEHMYEPFAGQQGILKLQLGWGDKYQSAIQKILDFDAALSPEEKKTILIDMLTMENLLSQYSALEIIYLEYHTNTFPTAPLIQPVSKFVQQPVNNVTIFSIQVLGRIGDKTVIPVLIELLASQDNNVAKMAFRVLKRMTRAEIEFDSQLTHKVKVKAIQKWRDWWEVNKDKVILVK